MCTVDRASTTAGAYLQQGESIQLTNSESIQLKIVNRVKVFNLKLSIENCKQGESIQLKNCHLSACCCLACDAH